VKVVIDDAEALGELLADLFAMGLGKEPVDSYIAWHLAFAIKHQVAARKLLGKKAA